MTLLVNGAEGADMKGDSSADLPDSAYLLVELKGRYTGMNALTVRKTHRCPF